MELHLRPAARKKINMFCRDYDVPMLTRSYSASYVTRQCRNILDYSSCTMKQMLCRGTYKKKNYQYNTLEWPFVKKVVAKCGTLPVCKWSSMSTLGTTKARDWRPYVCRRTLLFLRRHHVAGTFEAIQPTGTFHIMVAAIRGWRRGHTNLYALPKRMG